MIILSTATSSQTFTFIPRSFAISGELEVVDEETQLAQTLNIAITKFTVIVKKNRYIQYYRSKRNKFMAHSSH